MKQAVWLINTVKEPDHLSFFQTKDDFLSKCSWELKGTDM